jgi:uncharacterized membrane protein
MTIIYKLFISLSVGDGTITLLWAAYAIGLLSLSVVKSNKQLVNLALAIIVIVTIKFIMVDLRTVSVLWKIIVSMGFGTALLVLSYLLQPILNKDQTAKDTMVKNTMDDTKNI